MRYARPMSKIRNPDAVAYLYCLVVLIAFNLAYHGFYWVPLQWKLSKQMGLKAGEVSWFSLLEDIPAWVGFVFGFVRDRWRPWQLGDRAYFLIGAPLMALVYIGLAFCPPSYGSLLFWAAAQTFMQAFLGAATGGLMASVAQWHGMTGRIGALTVVTASLVNMLASSLGGMLDENFGHAAPNMISALVCLPMLLVAFWRPPAVFDIEHDLEAKAIHDHIGASLLRLARHKAIYLPAAANFLWMFSPGWGTSLLFFFTDDRHLSEATYGNASGLIKLGTLASSLSYTWLCLRFPFRKLAYVGTVGGIVGAALFWFTTDAPTAYVFSLLAGLSCGIPVGAYNDLIIRSCPKEYEGAAFMLFASAGFLASDVSDLFGAWLYDKGGFGLALLVTAITTGLILVVLALVSRKITDPVEGTPILEDLELVVGV